MAAEAALTPPTPQERRAIPRIIIKGAGKNNLHLRDVDPQTKTVVIADSNGKAFHNATNFPEKTQILAFSGLKIPNLYDLLYNSDKNALQNVKTYVVAVGVNNRADDDDIAPLADLMRSIQHWASHRNVRIIWTGIPQFHTPPENMQRTIYDLNCLAKDIFEQDFVPAISYDQIYPAPWDITGIHYTTPTAQIILDSVIKHLN